MGDEGEKRLLCRWAVVGAIHHACTQQGKVDETRQKQRDD